MGKDKAKGYYTLGYLEREALYRIISQVTCAPIEGIPYCKARGNFVSWEATARYNTSYVQFEGRTPLSEIRKGASKLEYL